MIRQENKKVVGAGYIRKFIFMGFIAVLLLLSSGCMSYLAGRYDSMWKNYSLPVNSNKGMLLFSVSWQSARPEPQGAAISIERYLGDEDSYWERVKKSRTVPTFAMWEPLKIVDDKGVIVSKVYAIEWPAGVYQLSPQSNRGSYMIGALILGRLPNWNYNKVVTVSLAAGKVTYAGNFVFTDIPNDKNWAVGIQDEFKRDLAVFLKYVPNIQEKDAVNEVNNLKYVNIKEGGQATGK